VAAYLISSVYQTNSASLSSSPPRSNTIISDERKTQSSNPISLRNGHYIGVGGQQPTPTTNPRTTKKATKPAQRLLARSESISFLTKTTSTPLKFFQSLFPLDSKSARRSIAVDTACWKWCPLMTCVDGVAP